MSRFLLHPAARMRVFSAGAALLGLGFGLLPASAAQLGASPLPVMSPAVEPSTAPSADMAPIPSTSPTPATGRHRRHHRDETAPTAIPSPTDTATPASASYTGFTGTWEMQLQRGALTSYSHMEFVPAAGTTLVGQWTNGPNTSPLTGEVDGDRFRLAGSNDQGPFTLSGYEENFTNLVGQMIQGASRVPFTARHQGGLPQPGPARHKHRHKGNTLTPHD